MSVEALAQVLHHSKATGTDKLVLVGIANHAGDGGAWPTIETLAKYANTTERTVQRSVSKLVRMGELHVERQAGGTRDLHPFLRPNRYDVLVHCPPGCDRSTRHKLGSYPQAQLSLVPDRVTPTSPGDTHVTPPGDTDVTQTTHKPSTQQVPRDVTHRREAPADPAVIAAAAAAARAKLRADRQAHG